MKQKPIRSPKHRKFVAMQICMISGTWSDDIHPHHLLRVNPIKGMGTKSCDMWCIPLGAGYHDELHRNGDEIGYLESHGWDYESVKLHALYWAKLSPDKKIREAACRYGIGIWGDDGV